MPRNSVFDCRATADLTLAANQKQTYVDKCTHVVDLEALQCRNRKVARVALPGTAATAAVAAIIAAAVAATANAVGTWRASHVKACHFSFPDASRGTL